MLYKGEGRPAVASGVGKQGSGHRIEIFRGGQLPHTGHSQCASPRSDCHNHQQSAALTESWAHAWWDRLCAKKLRAAGFDKDEVRCYSELVHIKDDAFSNRSEGYLTFRVTAEGQSGWIVSAKPGLWLAKQVADKMGSIAPGIMTEELRRP